MFILVCYDVETLTEGRKRLRKVAKHCESYGQQYNILFLNAKWKRLCI